MVVSQPRLGHPLVKCKTSWSKPLQLVLTRAFYSIAGQRAGAGLGGTVNEGKNTSEALFRSSRFKLISYLNKPSI
jgi:hypothetical protein